METPTSFVLMKLLKVQELHELGHAAWCNIFVVALCLVACTNTLVRHAELKVAPAIPGGNV
jgi:hypothetical protein